MGSLTVGTRVHLRPREAVDVEHTIRGGEAKITAVHADDKGEYYSVELTRTGRTRYARRADLVVHRADPDKRQR